MYMTNSGLWGFIGLASLIKPEIPGMGLFFFKLLGMELSNYTCMFTLPSDSLPGKGNFVLTFDL